MAARRRRTGASSRRDFKAAPRPTRRGLPGWVWLGGGLLLGLVLALFAFFRDPAMQTGPSSVPVALPKPEKTAALPADKGREAAEPDRQRQTAFSFYELLPNMFRTESAPDAEPPMRAGAAAPASAPSFHPADSRAPAAAASTPPPRSAPARQAKSESRPAGGSEWPRRQSRYFVQAGSFQRFAEADKLRAKLALEGLESRVQTYIDAQRRTWHRVRIGPFADRQQADRVGTRLRTGRLRPTVVKVRG
jgi:cell division protein FtsN